tara:strand:- start:291 stop:572 length:282 start_codon:yes stop_codon:yes gene_type:complete
MRALKFKDGTYQTEHGTINPQTWEGIEVIRGRQIDCDNVSIEVVLKEKEVIASGHYNIRTNWVHITMADELFEDMEDVLRDDIENRHLMLHAG